VGDPINPKTITGKGKMLRSEQRNQPPEIRRYRLHGAIVATLWTIAALWTVVDPLTGSHVDSTSRLMRSVSLLLVSAACTTLIVWLIQSGGTGRGSPVPGYPATRAFEIGYHAGRADALNESRPSLTVVTPLSRPTGQTGT
jgi:hypothetical protein